MSLEWWQVVVGMLMCSGATALLVMQQQRESLKLTTTASTASSGLTEGAVGSVRYHEAVGFSLEIPSRSSSRAQRHEYAEIGAPSASAWETAEVRYQA